MSSERETKQSQQVEATPEERELNRLALERVRAAQPGQIELQDQAMRLGQDLFTGLQTGNPESPILGRVFAGISPEVTQGIVNQSLEDIRPGLQASGLLNSGVRAELEAETASDIRRAVEESNLNTLFNLLNISQGQAATIQQPLMSQSQALGARLAGLRSTTGTSTYSYNPFQESLMSEFGSGLGKGASGAVTGGFGGINGGGGQNSLMKFAGTTSTPFASFPV